MLSRVRTTPTDICNPIDLGKEVFAITEGAAGIQGLKFGKAADEDKTLPSINKLVGWKVRHA